MAAASRGTNAAVLLELMNSARFEEKKEYLITFCHSTRARALDAAATGADAAARDEVF